MARLNKTQEKLLEEFSFVVESPPEKDTSRRSKWDGTWEAARQFCESAVGTTIRVRSYTNASMSYAEAKAINNGEHRHFKADGSKWTAVASKTDEVDDETEQPIYAIWLTCDEAKA